MNTHKSEKIEKFLLKEVKLTMYDGREEFGYLLEGGEYSAGRYRLIRNGKGTLLFYKSHIKKIEEYPIKEKFLGEKQ